MAGDLNLSSLFDAGYSPIQVSFITLTTLFVQQKHTKKGHDSLNSYPNLCLLLGLALFVITFYHKGFIALSRFILSAHYVYFHVICIKTVVLFRFWHKGHIQIQFRFQKLLQRKGELLKPS